MDLTQYAVIALALAGGALAKGATGMGLPLIALPVLTTALGLQHAIVVMTIPILVTNTWQVWTFRAEFADPALHFLRPMLVAGAVGVAVGTWMLTALPERWLAMALGLILLAYLALRLARPDLKIGMEAGRRAAGPLGLGAGLLQGATGISAPLGVTFIHAMRLHRPAHVGAVSAMFLALAVMQLPALAVAGLITAERLAQGLFALLPILIFMPVGQWLARRLSVAAFDRMILIFLGLIGLKLLFDL